MASKRFDGIYNNMYFFYNYDIRGSVTNIINPDGQIVKGYDYDEFGGTKEKGDYAFKNDVKFTGAVHDKSANLYYMNSRFYNPNTGRFITEDTYSGNAYEPWTQHLYTYTSNNPVNFIDPTGHRAMYAMDTEDETDVQRSTSLNQMKGYSAKDSYKIAMAKTKKQKQKAIKTAQENKEEKKLKEEKIQERADQAQMIASAVNVGVNASSTVLTGASKIFREWIVLGGGLERQFPYEALGKLRYGAVLGAGAFLFNFNPIQQSYKAGRISHKERIGLHVSNAAFTLSGVVAGVIIGALCTSALPAILVGAATGLVLYGAQKFVENNFILSKRE